MKRKIIIIPTLFILIISLTGCMKWIEFDLSRLAFGIIISIIMGIIALIFMLLGGGKKDK